MANTTIQGIGGRALRRGNPYNCLVTAVAILSAGTLSATSQEAVAPVPAQAPIVEQLRLADFIERVLAHNENLQIRMLDFEISRRRYASERGVFDPELVASYDRNSNIRENTAEQSVSQFGRQVFSESNNVYTAGLESLVPTGARIRLGYTLRDLQNSLQTGATRTNGEFQTFFGLNVTQPLLKNFGSSATMAGIRVAALNSGVVFQEYRRQLMLVVSTAEAAYWNLYMAQEQVRWLSESVALAETILKDNRTRHEAGRGSELEILEAQAGLALRKAKLEESQQRLQDALSQVVSLFQSTTVTHGGQLAAIDQPVALEMTGTLLDSWRLAQEQNPDYLAQLKRYNIEGVRLAYARNQSLPQLDLKGSYGRNGLGSSAGDSWGDVRQGDFPLWSVGVELRIPLGGVKSRNEVAASRLAQEKALRSLKDTEAQLVNALDTALKKAGSRRESIQSYQTIVSFSQTLLESQLARLQVGRVESRKVLEVEADLLQAKQSVTEAQVQYRRALLEKELVEGATLKNRNLELTQSDLQNRTRSLVRGGRLAEEEYRTFLQQLPVEYRQHQVTNTIPEAEIRARSQQALDAFPPGAASNPAAPTAPGTATPQP